MSFRRPLRAVRALGAAALAAATLTAPAAAADPDALVVFVEGLPPTSALRALLLEETPRAYAGARDWFGAPASGPVTVAWVTDSAALAQYAGSDPGPVAGLAVASRNLVVLFAPALQSRPDRIVTVLRHEICHLVFAAATAGAEVEPPRWLNEGVAMWWSGEWDLGLDYRTDHASLLRDANAAGSLLRFHELDGSFPSGPFFHVAYAQSRSFVEWMVRRGTEAGLKQFIARLDRDEDPAPAFRAVYGIPLAKAEEAWREEIGGGALGRLPSATVLINAAWGLLGLLVVVRFVVVRYRMHRVPEDPNEPPWPEPDGTSRPEGPGPLDSGR